MCVSVCVMVGKLKDYDQTLLNCLVPALFFPFLALSPLLKRPLVWASSKLRFYCCLKNYLNQQIKIKACPLWLFEMRLLCMLVSRTFGSLTWCIESPR